MILCIFYCRDKTSEKKKGSDWSVLDYEGCHIHFLGLDQKILEGVFYDSEVEKEVLFGSLDGFVSLCPHDPHCLSDAD